MFRVPVLTRRRIWLAVAVAIVTDGLQLISGPAGWVFFDGATDMVAMILISLLLGFRPLFLPTFVVKFIPIVDMIPTWTGCVAFVIALRRRQERKNSQPPPPLSRDVIDI
jgi:hypothetical protein